MKYFVYLLQSCKNNRYYIGCTVNCKKRLFEHNAGKNKSTNPYKPWKLIYYEKFSDKKLAFKREWHLKHPKGYLEKLEIIKKYGEIA